MIKKFKNFNYDKIITDSLKKLEAEIIDLNTKTQLFDKGIDSRGEDLPLPYAPLTVEIKSHEGQPIDRITLFDTGLFQRGFFVRFENDSFGLWSTDGKTDELVSQWGVDIFGLTPESVNSLIWDKGLYETILEEIRRYFEL